MTAVVNGIQYIGGQYAPDEFIKNQAATIDGTQTIESAVLSRTYYYSCNYNSNRNVGNSLMSKIEVNTVAPQCGTTLTLGESGDTVTLGSGASQSGFGRTGTVDWQTGSIKTATFTAANGEGYFCNTAGGTFEVDLPAGSAGAIVSVQDYNNTFDTNALTVDPNGSEKINGGAAGETVTLDTEGRGVTFVYIDSTVGWRSVQDNDFTKAGLTPSYVAATGGNSTATAPCGNYKIHTFTGPGTFCVSNAGNLAGNNQLEYIIVAGAGAGGGRYLAGGGGAGGFRFAAPSLAPLTYPAKPLAAPAGITSQQCKHIQ